MIFIVIISLSILVLIHELGHFLTAKFFGVKVEEFGFGFPPRIFGKKIGETVYSLNLLPFGGFVKIFGEDGEIRSKNSTNTHSDKIRELGLSGNFSAQPIWKRSVIVLAGIFMNVILGWLILSGVFMVGSPEHLMLNDVIKNSPAEIAGLKLGDIVLEAKSGNIVFKDPIKSEDFVPFVKSNVGGIFEVKILRDKQFLDFKILGRENPPPGEGALGVSLVDIGFPKENFFLGLWSGLNKTLMMLKLMLFSFFQLFSQIFIHPEIVGSITGPVGIYSIATQAGSLGIIYFLELIALISLNLAVLNFLPFPALDGGRFLFFLIEKIKGTPLSSRFQMIANTVGFVFLVGLMLIVTVQDVLKLM